MFDPIEIRELLAAEDRGFALRFKRDRDDVRSRSGLASNAQAFLNLVVNGLLLGLDGPAKRLLEMALEWVEESIASNETAKSGESDGFAGHRFHTLAMCKWLLRGEHDAVSLQHMIRHRLKFLDRSGLGTNKTEVSLTLSEIINAGEYDEAMRLFETATFRPPKPTAKVTGEATMAYIIARHHLGQEYTTEQVDKTARSFLTANMDKWLPAHGLRAAEWLKIVYWNDAAKRQLTPRDVVTEFARHYQEVTQREEPAADPQQASQEVEALLAAVRVLPKEFGPFQALASAFPGDRDAPLEASLAFLAAQPILGDSARMAKVVERAGRALDAIDVKAVRPKHVLMRAYDHLPGRVPPA